MTRAAEIRVAAPDDVPRLLPLLRAGAPFTVWTEASLRHRIERRLPGTPPARRWLVERGGEAVGYASASPFTGGKGHWETWATIEVAWRRRGLGSALLDAAVAHVRSHGGGRVELWAHDDAGIAFARARGFERGREERGLVLETGRRTVDVPPAPPGVAVVPLGAVTDRRRLHAVFSEAVSDIPGDDPEGIAFERFVRLVLEEPDLDAEASSVVLEAGRPVALSFLYADREGGVAVSAMTGTLRSHRRRGLARLAKATTLRRAVELGIRRFVTSSDAENAAMEALNRSLGFDPLVTYVQLRRPV